MEGAAGRGFKVSAVERAAQDQLCLGADRGCGVCSTRCKRFLGRAVPACVYIAGVVCIVCSVSYAVLSAGLDDPVALCAR